MQLTHELEDWIGKTVSPQSGAARDRTNFELGPRLEHKLSALLSKVLAKHVRSTVKILSTDSKVDLSRNLPLRLTSNTILRIFNNASHYMVRKEPGLNKSYINIVNYRLLLSKYTIHNSQLILLLHRIYCNRNIIRIISL